jgi:pilus assembly protein CpaF
LRFFAIVWMPTLAGCGFRRRARAKTLDPACPRPLNCRLVFSIVITERGGAQRQLDFEAPELSIGRLEDNDVVLPRSNVSKRHARIVLKDERYVLLDLKSTNGTYVNGRKINAPLLVGPGDKIYIGDFILSLQDSPGLQAEQRRMRERPATQPVASLRPGGLSEPLVEPGLGAPGAGPEPVAGAGRPRTGPPPPPAPGSVSNTQAPAPSERPPVPRTPPPPPPPEALAARAQGEPMPAGVTAPSPPATPVLLIDPLASPLVLPPVPSDGRLAPRRTSGPPAVRVGSVPPRLQDPDSAGPATSPAVLAPSVRLQGALQTLMERLAQRMDLSEPRERAFPSEQQGALEALIDELAAEGVIGPDLDRRFLTQAAISEAVGLGPLDRLLHNRAVREVVVDGPARILADLGGGLSPVSSFFSSTQAVQIALRRLCARGGKELSNAPIDEVLLPDGSQMQVLQPPLSMNGPLISIRCPLRTATSADGLVTEGVLSMDMLSLLRAAMQRRLNTLVVGPMANGVSTLVAAIASLCHDHERIVTLQDTPSLAIQHPHVLPLSTRGGGDRRLGELLRHAARLRPDRVVIDDLNGRDALDAMLGASATRGVIVGMHAPSPAAALEQLEMFAQVALGGARASLATLIAQAFQLLVHISADHNNVRRVLQIAEIRGAQGSTLEVAALYRYDNGWKAGSERSAFLS